MSLQLFSHKEIKVFRKSATLFRAQSYHLHLILGLSITTRFPSKKIFGSGLKMLKEQGKVRHYYHLSRLDMVAFFFYIFPSLSFFFFWLDFGVFSENAHTESSHILTLQLLFLILGIYILSLK